jgi:hypothetical protein
MTGAKKGKGIKEASSRSGLGKKPFYNKAYASKYYWKGKSKGPGEGARDFSSVTRGRRGRAAAAVGAHRARADNQEWVETTMYSNYGQDVDHDHDGVYQSSL